MSSRITKESRDLKISKKVIIKPFSQSERRQGVDASRDVAAAVVVSV